jgi:hypothetical protein
MQSVFFVLCQVNRFVSKALIPGVDLLEFGGSLNDYWGLFGGLLVQHVGVYNLSNLFDQPNRFGCEGPILMRIRMDLHIDVFMVPRCD